MPHWVNILVLFFYILLGVSSGGAMYSSTIGILTKNIRVKQEMTDKFLMSFLMIAVSASGIVLMFLIF